MSKDVEIIENGVKVIYRYKYLPFNEGSLRMITDGTLKFTSPLDFNDPFDCIPAYDPESVKNATDLRPDLVRKAAKELGFSPAKRLSNKWRFRRNVEIGVNSGEFARALISNLSVFCVSRTPCNPLMWAHYADCHQGFAVELRISMDAPKHLIDEITPHRVEYKKVRPVINWAHSGEQDVENIFLTKSEDWSYEQEDRVINPGQVAGIYPYSRHHFLCSVIAGAKISAPNYETLKTEVKKASQESGKEILLRKAQLAQHTYKVLIPGHPNQDFHDE